MHLTNFIISPPIDIRNPPLLQPWRLPADMAHFKRVTTQGNATNAVIMGRKTWDSIPAKFRPLEGRTNVVLTRSCGGEYPNNVLVASSLENALQQLERQEDLGTIFIIGGAQVYQEAIESGLVNKVIFTEVSNLPENQKLDAFFPKLDSSEWERRAFGEEDDKENGPPQQDDRSGLGYKFFQYTRIPEGPEVNPEEMQYLAMCTNIIENGVCINAIAVYNDRVYLLFLTFKKLVNHRFSAGIALELGRCPCSAHRCDFLFVTEPYHS